jgi:hypothetical protein
VDEVEVEEEDDDVLVSEVEVVDDVDVDEVELVEEEDDVLVSDVDDVDEVDVVLEDVGPGAVDEVELVVDEVDEVEVVLGPPSAQESGAGAFFRLSCFEPFLSVFPPNSAQYRVPATSRMMPELPAKGVVSVTPLPLQTNFISAVETTTCVHGSPGVPAPW